MTVPATAAFAPAFTHTQDATYDVRVLFVDGTSPVDVTLTTGSYRMCLAPTTGSVKDFVRALETAILAAISGASQVSTLALSLGADGLLTITQTNVATHEIDGLRFAAPVARRLGLLTTYAATLDPIVGSYPVWHLALLSSVKHGPWQPQQAGGAEQTTGGRVYAIAAAATSWQRTHDVDFQPTHPTQRTAQGAEATALLPAPEYMHLLGSTATAREWSVADVLVSARNAAAALTTTWRTARASTTEKFFVGYVGPASLLSPAFKASDSTWDAWAEWALDFVLPTTAVTETRA